MNLSSSISAFPRDVLEIFLSLKYSSCFFLHLIGSQILKQSYRRTGVLAADWIHGGVEKGQEQSGLQALSGHLLWNCSTATHLQGLKRWGGFGFLQEGGKDKRGSK